LEDTHHLKGHAAELGVLAHGDVERTRQVAAQDRDLRSLSRGQQAPDRGLECGTGQATVRAGHGAHNDLGHAEPAGPGNGLASPASQYAYPR
jgi:hypothetical protein